MGALVFEVCSVIKIQNLYYMLSYAFKVLNENGYKRVATENFENTAQLCTAILIRGINIQLKRGLERQYISKTNRVSSLRGKIDINESLKTQTFLRKEMVCIYDEFSVNSYLNRILKSTLLLLLKSEITKAQKRELKRLLRYFTEIDSLNVQKISWKIQYHKNNQTYQMLIGICYLVIKGLVQTQRNGTMKLMDFLDEQRMHRLYEKFILEYYRREFPQVQAYPSQIAWYLDNDESELLPIMQSDVMLTYQNRVLVIDAKYYSHTTQSHYESNTLHSSNLYQIFTYVKNKAAQEKDNNVSGMLLYAKTDEDITPNHIYQMSGNQISVKTLDLNLDFSQIKEQLNQIVFDHFPDLKRDQGE